MDIKFEQRVCLKFCVKNELSCAESLKMLHNAYGESCMSKGRAYEWYRRFKEGREDVNDDEHIGQPTTSVTEENIETTRKLVLENGSTSTRELATLLNVSYGSAETILKRVTP